MKTLSQLIIAAVIGIILSNTATAQTGGKQIGEWCDTHLQRTIIISKLGGGAFTAESIFADGDTGNDPLTKKGKFYEVIGNRFQEKYKILNTKDLGLYDNEGFIYSATAGGCKSIKRPQSKKTKEDPLGLGQATLDDLKDKKIPFHKWNEWGNPQTLKGTNNQQWVAYLPKANVSFISTKKTNVITYIQFGKGAEKQATKVPKWIKKQFSVWNGSHRKLTKYIKSGMHSPKSYKHVKTVYSERDGGLIVTATFRGKNAFGGVVTNRIRAKVDKSGNVLSTDWLE